MLDPTCPRVKNVLLLDGEGKRIAVKYYSSEWWAGEAGAVCCCWPLSRAWRPPPVPAGPQVDGGQPGQLRKVGVDQDQPDQCARRGCAGARVGCIAARRTASPGTPAAGHGLLCTQRQSARAAAPAPARMGAWRARGGFQQILAACSRRAASRVARLAAPRPKAHCTHALPPAPQPRWSCLTTCWSCTSASGTSCST